MGPATPFERCPLSRAFGPLCSADDRVGAALFTLSRADRPAENGDTKMKRRTLDITLATGGLVIATLLAVLAFAVASQYSFATNYVKDELGSQKIVFTDADKLTADEKTWQPG